MSQINNSAKSHSFVGPRYEHIDSEMIFQDWSYNWDDYNDRILHDLIQFRNYKNVNMKEVIKGEFLETPHYLDWATTFGPI